MQKWQKCGLLTAILFIPIISLEVADWNTFQLTSMYEVSEFLCYFLSICAFLSCKVVSDRE